jgi:phosphoribosyl-dephospho-CoA transferase
MESSLRAALRQTGIEPICDNNRAEIQTRRCALADRHDFAWLGANAPIAAAKANEHVRIVQWVRRGLPAVVARRSAGLAADELNLGIALPASYGRVRIGFTASLPSLQKISSPPPLAGVIASAPRESRPLLRDLCGKAEALGVEFHVYGSYAWQHLTGECYVTRSSDIDLLWRPRHRDQLMSGIMLCSSWERQSGLSLDGEIVWPDGAAVAWREMAAGKDCVLVKCLASVSLQSREALLRKLAP